MPNIIIKGAKVHNLKDIDIEIERNKISVLVGVSGSGKSTIAYDIIRLKKVKAVETAPAIAFDTSDSASVPSPLETLSPAEIYPLLDPKYSKKKFAFNEGLCLQYADGKNSLEDISEKCSFPVAEVRDIVDKYEKKGWIEIIHKK